MREGARVSVYRVTCWLGLKDLHHDNLHLTENKADVQQRADRGNHRELLNADRLPPHI
jgi:hypothetical protein